MLNDKQQEMENKEEKKEYSYDDINKVAVRDIAEGKEAPVIEKPKEEEEEIALDDLKKNIKDDLKKDQEEERKKLEEEKAKQEEERKIEEAANEAKEQKKVVEDTKETDEIYLKWAKEFGEKNNRAPTYLEAMQFVTEQAAKSPELIKHIKEELKREDEANKAIAEKQRADAEKKKAAENKVLNDYVDEELSLLYANNKLTPIKEKDNPEDLGIKERMEFFKQWKEVNDKRRAEGKREIISPTTIFTFYYKKPNFEVAGADAPIAGNKGSIIPPSSEQQIDYSKDVAGKPWSFFRRKP